MPWFYNRALPWVLPQTLLLARPSSEIVIVSPWLDDVTLYPPRRAGSHPLYDSPETRLSELLRYLAVQSDVRVGLIVRKRDAKCGRAVRLLEKAKPEYLWVHQLPRLHAKAIVTEAFVLETSANVLHYSIHKNIEACSLQPNPYNSARQWVTNTLNISL